MDDPSKLITDSMLQGRVKANGHLETWAQSRSTNLLDSTDPSKMVLNSQEEAILKTSGLGTQPGSFAPNDAMNIMNM